MNTARRLEVALIELLCLIQSVSLRLLRRLLDKQRRFNDWPGTILHKKCIGRSQVNGIFKFGAK